jgi:hypothetical protein
MSQQRRPRVYICIGPSISAAEVRREWATTPADLHLLPPIQQGDVLKLRADQPDVLGIVDGYFFQTPAVTHKEILYALDLGVRVLGASSLGALRAAELDVFGMEGIGEIYRMYKAGALDGDDEVAVVHADADSGYRPLGEPLVNIRHNLGRARARGLVSARTAAAMIAAAKRLPFTERNYAAIFAAAGIDRGEMDTLRSFLRNQAADLKHADALALVRTIAARTAGTRPWPERPPVRARRTSYLHHYQQAYLGRSVDGRHVPDQLVLSFLKLLSPALPRMVRRATLRCLAVDEALERGISPQADTCLVAGFRERRGLGNSAAWADWLRDRCMAPEELAACLRERDLEAQLLLRYQMLNAGECRAAHYRQIIASVAVRTGLAADELLSGLWMRGNVPWDAPLLRETKLRGHFRRALGWVAPLAEHSEMVSQRVGLGALAATPSMLERWAAERWAAAEPFERRCCGAAL